MKRELGVGLRALWRRPLAGLLVWSVPEVLPTAVSGYVVAQAIDSGFLAGDLWRGLAWLGALFAASLLGGLGSRGVFRYLGALVEPFRDTLARHIVAGALTNATAGRREDGAVARLTRQLEIVRDTYAGLILLTRGFAVTVVGVAAGLLSLSPLVAAVIVPPFLLGLGLFAATIGIAAGRYRTAVAADERLASEAGTVLGGARDIVATGTEDHAAGMVADRATAQAKAELALARLAVLRTGCFVVGAWLPLALLLFAGPWLVAGGASAGTIMGGLTYILFGLQPALNQFITGTGDSGLRFIVTLRRILDAGGEFPTATTLPESEEPRPDRPVADTSRLRARDLSFRYGPRSERVVDGLDLDIQPGEHLAIVGQSGIGKSTLACLLCGLLPPDTGEVTIGGQPVAGLPPRELAELRVLIPQQAYVFSGTVADNLTYLNPYAPGDLIDEALDVVGAAKLVSELGGPTAEVSPAQLTDGQRQLIALARAYLSPAPLVFLDEATCHLDPAAEERAELAFAARGGSLVVIAHRISSALRAKRIMVMDGPRSSIGTHTELLSRSPLYRDLVGYWNG
ncbi:ABC transporter ATP-binding protein [Stackebrandtia nassauensis]|uniref:ABC transporter related protein n=1 Tax=Stackebrandtia nassauensis (strain DSM 44728 / CIP 108903 / NRRL B-16338 / NBRC 102104 / LLR-40K-21) TaxID=446470 RepID=D3Q5V0_STANL|nr:ATP-binding cassette domain-containing protein [Stackebrandtia nassauensis]ADD40249.1 ABC transporter related protein [Stackebrandtia nassauensis DSM 44728]